jgi:protein-S-isoprenylcysteine O-methyltransferase Ste14
LRLAGLFLWIATLGYLFFPASFHWAAMPLPYRWVRHPFYVTAALLMGSVTLITANWLIGVNSVLVLILLAVRTPKEEQMLIERFGDEYRGYMVRTGRFFPRFPS